MKGKPIRRFLSWLTLAVSVVVCAKLLQLIIFFAIGIASAIHDMSGVVFWVIIIFGGSFGLGIAFTAAMIGSVVCIALSQKVRKSAKGTRYKVTSIIVGLLFALDIVASLFTHMSGLNLLREIVYDIYMVIFSFILFFSGVEKALEESPEDDDVLSKKEETNKDDLNGYKASDNSRIPNFSNTPGDIPVLSNEYIFNSVNDVDEIIRKRFDGYTNPITDKPINGAKDYLEALDAQQRSKGVYVPKQEYIFNTVEDIDKAFVEHFGSFINPITKQPVKGVNDYLKAIDAQNRIKK